MKGEVVPVRPSMNPLSATFRWPKWLLKEAKRMVEHKRDVVILLDSITRLGTRLQHGRSTEWKGNVTKGCSWNSVSLQAGPLHPSTPADKAADSHLDRSGARWRAVSVLSPAVSVAVGERPRQKAEFGAAARPTRVRKRHGFGLSRELKAHLRATTSSTTLGCPMSGRRPRCFYDLNQDREA